MSDELIKTGGKHKVKRVGKDQYSFSIEIPRDRDGLMGRECADENCSPAYFKVKPGTGITEDHEQAFCPYCGVSAEPDDFVTKAQLEYGKKIITEEAIEGAGCMLKKSLGLDRSGKRTLGGGLISLELSMKEPRRSPVGRPIEEELRRDVRCPDCGLDHAVFGLATWCPDCGSDIFTSHLAAELNVLRKVLAAVDTRREELGPRVAARDIENTLEDVVSVFEVVLKILAKRHLLARGTPPDDVDKFVDKEIRTAFQNVSRARALLLEKTGAELGRGLEGSALDQLEAILEKRHPIAHNLGVIDRKYLDRVRSGEIEGREMRVTAKEVGEAVDLAEAVLRDVHAQLFSA